MFLVRFEKRIYALTCCHVFGDFAVERLFVADEKHAKRGSKPGRIAGWARPSLPIDGADGTDIVDLCVIWFDDEPSMEFNGVFDLNTDTAGTSSKGHQLLVEGVLKEKTRIVNPDIDIGYCTLEMRDVGPFADPFLRAAEADFLAPKFSEIAGVSGAPVFDTTLGKLCGMAVRGGMQGTRCRLYYFDMADILRFLTAVGEGQSNVYYNKAQPAL